MNTRRIHLISILLLSTFLAACGQVDIVELPTQPATGTPVITTPTFTLIPPTDTPAPTSTATPTPEPTATPTETATPTLVPTYAVLRGEVLEVSNCRYGPGPDYLYKYGLLKGNRLDIIGRTKAGNWILVQAIGGNNPCWLSAKLMDIQGDVMSVEPVDVQVITPWSPYYGPLTGVTATRSGDQVTVSWTALELRAGDDSEQTPYVVEAWVCDGTQLIFTPVGAYDNQATITDLPGCTEPSHARVMAAEKHGYTKPVEVPWPPAVPTATP